METLVIALAALFASCLTLFSGFGLGTLLMPVVAVFFPLDVAIAMTAMVHFSNNVFKLGLLGSNADRGVVLRFGVPAIVASLLGALLLAQLSHLAPLHEYALGGATYAVMPVKLAVGAIIIVFVALELSPRFAALSVDRRFLPLGGCISGFFGGLSGHQGAFRSMFLIKAGIGKEQFIATGVVLAVLVDMTRLLAYGWEATTTPKNVDWLAVGVAATFAFAGAFIGARLVKKLTITAVQRIVSILLVIVGLGLACGIL
ncbi:MAG: TSUP family transporter [Propionivibrio sp.]